MPAAEIRAGDAGGGGGRAEGLQLLGAAEQLLGLRDLARSRAFADRAMEADPLLDGADRVLAAADVLLAAQRGRVNNHLDWYAVLQLDASVAAASASAVRLQYRRLALLLRPDPRHGSCNLFAPPSSFAAATDEAFNLVCDAWAVLSDPAKKELYDKEIEIAAAAAAQHTPDDGGGGGETSGEGAGEKATMEAEIDGDASFWTACTRCCHVYEYPRGYEDQSLLCQNCGRAFQAAEMKSPPPVVPGMDMYFCAWGLFPLGFPGGPKFVCPNSANGRRVGHVGRRKKAEGSDEDEDEDWVPKGARKKQNQRSKRGRPNGRLVLGNDVGNKASGMPSATEKSPRRTRSKVMASMGKKQAAGAEESGVVASGEAEIDVDPSNKEDGEIQQGTETRADGMRNPQKAGCSRTVEMSVEDLNLNFAIDVNAAAAIIESMGNDPGYNNLRWFEDCFRGTFNP